MKVFKDLKTRGVSNILIAVADGLRGMAGSPGAVSIAGSMIGGIPETQEMLDFCAKRGIAATRS